MTQEESAKKAAAAVWGCRPDETFSQDVSTLYPWLHKYVVYLVKSIDHRRMLVTVSRDGDKALPLRRTKDIEPLNHLFQDEQVKLPGGLSPEQLAAAIRSFTQGPGGFVGSQAFWQDQQRSLKIWTSRMPPGGPELFQKYCANPVVSQDGPLWMLTFFFFNDQGGIEKWSVSGDANKIRQTNFSAVLPNGTLVFPYG